MDFVEVTMGGSLSAVFSAPPHRLDAARLAWLLSASNAGAIIGAPVTGWIADKRGLQATLIWTVWWLAITAVLAAFSPTIGWLTAARFLGGIALGAYPPLMMAYLTDILPTRRRGTLIFSICAVSYLAPPAAIFATRALTVAPPLGFEGWRWVFLAAGAICALSALLWRWAPEAPHWLAARGLRNAVIRVEARFAQSRRLFATRDDSPTGLEGKAEGQVAISPRSRPFVLVVMCALYALIGCATVAFPLLTGPVLLQRHFSLSDTLFYVGLATFGPVLGALFGGVVTDRIGRPPVMAGCALIMLASVPLFFFSRETLVMAGSIIAFGLCSTLFIPAMTVYAAELFVPSMRGRATSLAWACNRVGATVSPVIFLNLIHNGETPLAAIGMVGALAASLVAIVVLPRSGRQGRQKAPISVEKQRHF
jgi:putative MFS transporter